MSIENTLERLENAKVAIASAISTMGGTVSATDGYEDYAMDILTIPGGSGTSDFDQLSNRPSYNGSTMTHSTNIPLVKTSTWDAKQDKKIFPIEYGVTTVAEMQDAIDAGYILTMGSAVVLPNIVSTSGSGTAYLGCIQCGEDSSNSGLYYYEISIINGTWSYGVANPVGTYIKPSSGIPKTDLASAVQTSLGLADTALQSVPNTYRTASAQDAIDATKQAQHTTASATLATASWSNKAQTVSVSGVTASNTVIVSPAPASVEAWATAKIYCSAQGAGTLTFTCIGDAPSSDVVAEVVILA